VDGAVDYERHVWRPRGSSAPRAASPRSPPRRPRPSSPRKRR
jgi:hypothetical protein